MGEPARSICWRDGDGTPAVTPEAGVLFRSQDTGATWERVDIGDVPPSRMARITIDCGAPALVSCCAMLGQVYISQDGGATALGSVPRDPGRPRGRSARRKQASCRRCASDR